jgi:hypothetical protein
LSDTNDPTPPADDPDLVRVVFEGRGPDAYVWLADEDVGPVEAVEVPAYMWDAYRLAWAQTASAYALMRRYVDRRAEKK